MKEKLLDGKVAIVSGASYGMGYSMAELFAKEGAKMLEYSKHFVYFPGPECDPMDQANACLFLASDMGRHVKGQVIQVCNGAFL